MKKLLDVSQNEVWKHWMRVENFSDPNFRSDIRDTIPDDISWCVAEIEDGDVDSMFIISTGDWKDISAGSFLVSKVASRLNFPSDHADTQRIGNNIRKKLDHIVTGGHLDPKLIAVTHDDLLIGPFTFIEGNRRAVAFAVNGSLVGSKIYIGVSSLITDYKWANATYQSPGPDS
jgi:hypothetical protein